MRGDLLRQPFSFRAPKPFFVDGERRCLDCGRRFVLGARAQKRWCEALGLELDSRASRCAACRRRWLGRHGLRAALSDAARALSDAPLHAPAAIAYARAAVASAERLGAGPLDAALAVLDALSAAGKPAAVESLYWAGRCHEAASRKRRADAAYRLFLAAARDRDDVAGLRFDAEARTRSQRPL